MAVGRLGGGDGYQEDRLRRVALALVLVLVLVGCSGPAADPFPAPDPVNRLAVIDGASVVTMTPTGDDRLVVHDEADTVPFQPIWSPDGAYLAYSFIADTDTYRLAVASADGSAVSTAETETNVFYMQWSPASDRLGALRNHVEGGVALDIAHVGTDALDVDLVDDGGSYYFAFSPDGDDLAVHVGSRFDILSDEGPDTLEETPGSFQAPMWMADGIFGIRKDGDATTVARYQPDGAADDLVEVAGPTSFHVSPDGSRIALQSLGDAGVVEASWGNGSAAAQTLAANRVHVVDLDSGEATQVADRLVTGFWWSPDGTKLLILLLPNRGRPEMAWQVWEDGVITEGPRFFPHSGWATDLIPFVDQYNRSMTPWSPDSTSIAFPGSIDNDPGIWVAEVGGGAEKVSDGTWVTWSWS